jgi:hypothetical protein
MTNAALATFETSLVDPELIIAFSAIAGPGMKIKATIKGCGGGGGGGGGGGEGGGGGGGGAGASVKTVSLELAVADQNVPWQYMLKVGKGGEGRGMTDTLPPGQNGQTGGDGEPSKLLKRPITGGEWEEVETFSGGAGGKGGMDLLFPRNRRTGGSGGEGVDGGASGGWGGELIGPGDYRVQAHGSAGSSNDVASGGNGGKSKPYTGVPQEGAGGGSGGGGGAGMGAGGDGAGIRAGGDGAGSTSAPTPGVNGGGGGGGHGWGGRVENDRGADGGNGKLILEVVEIVLDKADV